MRYGVNAILQALGNALTGMVCDEGCDSEGGGDEGVATVQQHGNEWVFVEGNIILTYTEGFITRYRIYVYIENSTRHAFEN